MAKTKLSDGPEGMKMLNPPTRASPATAEISVLASLFRKPDVAWNADMLYPPIEYAAIDGATGVHENKYVIVNNYVHGRDSNV